jgi:hypothetical protein
VDVGLENISRCGRCVCVCVCEERRVLRCVSRVAAAATTVNKVFFRGLTMFLNFFKINFLCFYTVLIC